MVGVISPSLTTIIERIERAAALGFSAFQISLPNWGTLSDHELRTFFREVCGRFPELRFLHYNLPRDGTDTHRGGLCPAGPPSTPISSLPSTARVSCGR